MDFKGRCSFSSRFDQEYDVRALMCCDLQSRFPFDRVLVGASFIRKGMIPS